MANTILTYNIDNNFDKSFEAFDASIVNNTLEDIFSVKDAQDFVYGVLEQEANRYLTFAEKSEVNQLILDADYLIGGFDGIVQKIELKAVFEKIESLINADIFTDVTPYNDYQSNTIFTNLEALGKELEETEKMLEAEAMTQTEMEAMTKAEMEAMMKAKAEAEAMTKAEMEAMTKAEMEAMMKAKAEAMTNDENKPDMEFVVNNTSTDTDSATLSNDFIQEFLTKLTQIYGIDTTQFDIVSYATIISNADSDGDGELSEVEFKVLLQKIESILETDFFSDKNKTDASTLNFDFTQDFLISLALIFGINSTRFNLASYATIISQADTIGDGNLSEVEFKILFQKIKAIFEESGIEVSSDTIPAEPVQYN
jgi:hypothetical protein